MGVLRIAMPNGMPANPAPAPISMKLHRFAAFALLSCLALFPAQKLLAGPYSDALAKRLVESTTPAEKRILVRWMFAAMSLHPDLSDVVSMSSEQRTEANKAFAELITRMMTQTCATEAKAAMKYEGPSSLEYAFNVFGQVAARELFANPKVAAGMGELQKMVDGPAIQKALLDEPAAPAAPEITKLQITTK